MTKIKEKPVTVFSQKVSDMLSSYKGMPDSKLFNICILTSSSDKDLQGIIKTFVERQYGVCVFYKPSVVIKDESVRYTVYASRLTEQELIKILNLKAFW